MGRAEGVADRISVVPGFANVIVFQTDDGLVLVDTGLEFTAETLFEAVRARSADPVRYAVFTHGHFDHVSGLGPFDAGDLAFVAHEPVQAQRRIACDFRSQRERGLEPAEGPALRRRVGRGAPR